MKIFVTGKSGVGKSTFGRALAEKLGYKYIEFDQLGFMVYRYREVREEAERLFGGAIYDEAGNLDAKKVGQCFFNERDSERVKNFKNLTWGYIKELVAVEFLGDIVAEWISFPESRYWKVDAVKVLLEVGEEECRVQSIMARDKISREEVLMRDKCSHEYDLEDFDFVLVNDYSEEMMLENVEKVYNYVKTLENEEKIRKK